MKSASKNLFFALALISLVWNLSQTMMKGTEINSLLFDLVKFTLTVGFFYWLIEGVDTIIEPLFDKFGSFGASTFGGSANDVAGLIKFGTDTATQIFEFKGADTDTSLWDFDVFSWFLVFFQAGIALLVLFTTYIMAMKDEAGLVKMYALVNVEKYNIVATGASQHEALSAYKKLMKENGISQGSDSEAGELSKQINIETIRYVDVSGETIVYIIDKQGNVYKQAFAENEALIFLKEGDRITVHYEESEDGIHSLISYE